jgi:hypothetical protein
MAAPLFEPNRLRLEDNAAPRSICDRSTHHEEPPTPAPLAASSVRRPINRIRRMARDFQAFLERFIYNDGRPPLGAQFHGSVVTSMPDCPASSTCRQFASETHMGFAGAPEAIGLQTLSEAAAFLDLGFVGLGGLAIPGYAPNCIICPAGFYT